MNLHSLLLMFQTAPDSLPITPIASLGVGGALALVMFWFYRNDRLASEKRFTEYRDAMDERYDEISKDFKMIVQENTQAATKLAAVIDRVLSEKR